MFSFLVFLIIFPNFSLSEHFINLKPTSTCPTSITRSTSYNIPLVTTTTTIHSICTHYFTSDTEVEFVYDSSTPTTFTIKEYHKTGSCNAANIIRSEIATFGACFTSQILKIRFFIPSHSTTSVDFSSSYVLNNKDYLLQSNFPSSTCSSEIGDQESEVVQTNYEVSGDETTFRYCNDSFFLHKTKVSSVTNKYISKLQPFSSTECTLDPLLDTNPYSKFECVNSDYITTTGTYLHQKEFMIVNIFDGETCTGNVAWQDIIRNRLCFSLGTNYRHNLFKTLMHDSLGINLPTTYSIRETVRTEVSYNTLFFEVFSNPDCQGFPFYSRMMHPGCNTFLAANERVSEYMYTDFNEESLVAEPGRVLMFQNPAGISCENPETMDRQVFEERVKDIILNRNFDLVISAKSGTCLNSFFELYFKDQTTSILGICEENEFQRYYYPLNDKCSSGTYHETTQGNYCIDSTNLGTSSWYTCVPNICFGKTQFESGVCNGRGKCVGSDKCDCTVGWWYGDECDNSGWAVFLPIMLPSIFCCIFCWFVIICVFLVVSGLLLVCGGCVLIVGFVVVVVGGTGIFGVVSLIFFQFTDFLGGVVSDAADGDLEILNTMKEKLITNNEKNDMKKSLIENQEDAGEVEKDPLLFDNVQLLGDEGSINQ